MKKKFLIIACFLVIFSIIEIPTGFFKTKIFLVLAADNSLTIVLRLHPEGCETICADGSTPVLLDVSVYDTNQNPVPFSLINFRLNNFQGRLKPAYPITDKNGRVLVSIYPENINAADPSYDVSIVLTAKKAKPARWDGKITNPPVLLLHGFQDSSESMVPLMNYLSDKGLMVYTLDYQTNTDLSKMSGALDRALNDLQSNLKAKGIYAGKVDIVSHSLGGLVARYYSTQSTYIEKQNIRKIIFINVPHHGTPWAEAGAELLNSPILKELYPTSALYTYVFPNSINKGLNHTIQTANIALENDEVVPPLSSKLSSWNIDTKMYRIGSEPLNLDTVINSQIHGGSRHRQLLFYTPVFEEIYYCLTENLNYPQKRK